MDDMKMLASLAEVVKNSREEVFVFNKDGSIVYANEVAYTETEYKDFSGVDITTIFPMSLHHVRNSITWQSDSVMQTFAYRENKTCYPVKLTCFKLDAMDGEQSVAYAVNDTERYNAVRNHRKAMEEVEEANKMKNEFTANITHELRTPINGIKGMAEGLMMTELAPSQEETVGIILHCCENMTKIINDILDFSKMEAGKIEIVNAEFSLNKFINDQLSFHIGKINEKGLKLIVNVSGDVPDMIIGDELRLGQVLNNLFSNAIKFTSQGHIAIEITANKLQDDEVELFFLIMDTGIGISEAEKDKLFKSFSQVDGSITRRFGGTGLGLAITKQLVTLMGGTISVDSEKGKGSTFSFTVKVRKAAKNESTVIPKGNYEFKKDVPVANHAAEELNIGNYATVSSATFSNTDNIEIGEEDLLFTDEDSNPAYAKIRENLERLLICIELSSWEKAENYASVLKTVVSEDKPELKNKAFSLLLNVRKEKYDEAIKLIDELGEEYGI